ncbi:ribonuclease P protein component [Mycolicibacter minnesotensis]|uniref:Ribonuclease P protein component n=1 Tax=Mycolicibacter minnesotensis TaxID=1118379 RepID=A0A7I7R5F4_9MYCO|nr:ribonuclease P protein component [Mycolicibacter minnesotensis]ORB00327.1 ribonuclease P protein component [Mycolicibacter minnesotensis]BBY33692.1 ribonuclease P protein component [Mycolicibacter minnesotensis]
MLPAQYRMRRSADFGATVRHGRRAVQPDLVIYDRRTDTPEPSALDSSTAIPPRVGLIIAKSVGPAVTRHRVARRLRHVARDVLADLEPCEQLVIRALPGSSNATSEALGGQLRAGLRSIRRTSGAVR